MDEHAWFGQLRDALAGRRSALALGLVVGLGVATPAQAHIEMIFPVARYPSGFQKTDPCGHPDNPPGEAPPTVFEPGQTIMLQFNEFVQHTGYFRVALDPTGTDAFTSPMDFDDFYNSPEVLLDDIPDDMDDGGVHVVEVTLPDMPCDPCTLQVIQVMTDDGAFGPGNDDLYFQCSDIVIGEAAGTGDPTAGDTTTTGPSPGDSSGAAADGDSSGGDPGTFTSGDDSGSSGSAADSGADEDGGCSCRAAPGPAGAAPWLLVVLWARRRR